MRILVIEDDDDIRKALADILEFEDYFVHGEPDGSQALEWLLCNPRPGVILLDLKMPKMNGYDFRTEQLKHHELRLIPVIVITGSREPVAESFGFHLVLRKPFSIDELAAAIRSVPLGTDPRLSDITQSNILNPRR